MTQAFILGAGLGTRLRPLTHQLPKPLVPLFHRPLAAWTMDACMRAGIGRFAINTHHLPDAWNGFVQRPEFQRADITLFHEPVLLETGGGLKNIESWSGGQPVLVHNGDIFSTMPLEKLIAAHEASDLPVTLAMRSAGGDKRVALDDSLTRVIDVRNNLGVAKGTHVFSGIYCVNAGIFDLIPDQEVVSVIPAFLELTRRGLLGAVVIDEGVWLDLGDRESYLAAHRDLELVPAIHPGADVAPDAVLENAVVGPGAVIGAGARLINSVVWPGGSVAAGADLDHCIVYSEIPAAGLHHGEDL